MTQRPIRRRIKGVMFRLPMMITCERFETFLGDYIDGTLPPDQRRKFELHLRVCRECRDYLAAYQAARAATRMAFAKDLTVDLGEAPADLVQAVLASRAASA